MSNLPTFDQMRDDAHRELVDVLDGMRSDWSEGPDNNAQTKAWREARALVEQARAKLDEVARKADPHGSTRVGSTLFVYTGAGPGPEDYYIVHDEDDEDGTP